MASPDADATSAADPLRPLLARMRRSGAAVPDDGGAASVGAVLRGCTPEEVAALEARYGLRLPHTYRRYLELMGHAAGRLFTHDHIAAAYRDVMAMTAELRELEGEPDEGCPLRLPEDALVMSGRQGDDYLFIRCADAEDSPVWHFDVYRWAPREVYPSVVAWLEAWCAEAEGAIERGYFDANPRGTW